MPEASSPVCIVLTTTANADEAARLGRTLVEERLAACATLIPAVQSIYRWKGEIESSTETLLLIKTGPEQLAALEARRDLTAGLLALGAAAGLLAVGAETATHPLLGVC